MAHNKVGVIYYTDNRPDPLILRTCQDQIRKCFNGKIVSVSLRPIDFGKNIVLGGRVRSYPTMMLSILTALEALDTENVFFTEHDVLYHPSHFEFIPPRPDVYYYNCNNWRWKYPEDLVITYDYLTSLSQLCCNRLLAIEHFKKRIQVAKEQNLDEHRAREPRWARRWGYEPGTKPIRRGGFTDEVSEKRWSRFPNIDIRHAKTFTKSKTCLADFKHKPFDSWKEAKVYELPGWSRVKEMFNL
jgi:hypothetical protein